MLLSYKPFACTKERDFPLLQVSLFARRETGGLSQKREEGWVENVKDPEGVPDAQAPPSQTQHSALRY